MKHLIVLIAIAVLAASAAKSQQISAGGGKQAPSSDSAGEMGIHPASGIKWTMGPASLPAGAKVAVLEGDPGKEGFFTMRLWFPDGYRVAPHWHPKVEHVTVISGSLNLGMGEKFDQTATRELPAGTFGFWPAGMRHFAWAKGDTVIQLHGIGPWVINYVNPSDDPRNKK
jgi:quercetin dioxygenase-like cupin family protein